MSRRRNKSITSLPNRATARLRNLRKQVYWRLFRSRCSEKKVVLLVGCQCSGTTTLNRIFDRDFRAIGLGEDNGLTGHSSSRLRLKPFDEVNRLIAACPAPILVFEPKVESQNTPRMLENIPGSQAVWMFRNYREVVQAKLQKFRQQTSNVRIIAEQQSDNWRSEGVSPAVHDIVSRYYSEKMSPSDAAALMWYARNILFFECELDVHPSVTICQYEELVTRPQVVVKRLYDVIGLELPGHNIAKGVDNRPLNLGHAIELDPEINALCSDLQARLECCYREESRPPDLLRSGAS